MLLRGNLLPVNLLMEEEKAGKKLENILDFINTLTPQNFFDDLVVNTNKTQKLGYAGDKFHVFVFKDSKKDHEASNDSLRFLKASSSPRDWETKQDFMINYTNTSMEREGIEIGAKLPEVFGIESVVLFSYWQISRHHYTYFSGTGTVTDEKAHLKGGLLQYDSTLNAFRKEPYSGYGYAVNLDLSKELKPGLEIFLHGYPLVTKQVLQNTGVLMGILDSEREYFDEDDYLNYKPLIKGRYEYDKVTLPSTADFKYGIKYDLNEKLLLKIKLDKYIRPEIALTARHNNLQITGGYLYPSLHTIAISVKNISVGGHFSTRKRIGLTSLGFNLSGFIQF